MSDARHAWAAHYAAVKARIATGQRSGAAPAPAPAPPAPPAPPAAPAPPADPPAPPADPPVLYKTDTAWIKLTRAEHAALPHVKARAAKLSDKAARRARMDARMASYRLTQEQLAELCADITSAHKTTWLVLVGRSPGAVHLRPRLEVYRRLLALGWSYTAIGKACGRDHSTIMYYIRRWGTTDEQA
tara:strand:- start:1422 stop:1982 length:561 start_codon:yes stop_codon:yes gene_type:complete